MDLNAELRSSIELLAGVECRRECDVQMFDTPDPSSLIDHDLDDIRTVWTTLGDMLTEEAIRRGKPTDGAASVDDIAMDSGEMQALLDSGDLAPDMYHNTKGAQA